METMNKENKDSPGKGGSVKGSVRWRGIVIGALENETVYKELGGKRWVLQARLIREVRKVMGDAEKEYRDRYIWYHCRKQLHKMGHRQEGRGQFYVPMEQGLKVSEIRAPEVTDELLARFVPAEVPGDYIPQAVPGGTDIDLLKKAFAAKRHVLIEGPTGCGKTTAVWLVHAELKAPMWSFSAHERLDFEDLVGRWVPYNGGWKFVKGPVYIAAEYGMTLVMEEVNMTLPALMSFMHAAMDDTRIVTITQKMEDGTEMAQIVKVHPNFWVVGTMNRGYEGTKPLNKALARRFRVKLEYGHPKEAEAKLLPGWVRKLAEVLRGKPEVIQTPVSFGLLKDLRDNESLFGKEASLWFFLNSFLPEERPEVKEVIYMTTGQHIANTTVD